MTEAILNTLDRLRPFLHAPTITIPVLDCIENAGRPLTCGEVAAATGIHVSKADRALRRLADKGMLERWKAPVVGSYRGHHGAPRCAGRTTWRKSVWLYAAPSVDNGDRQ